MCANASAAAAAARQSARPCTAASCRGRKPSSCWDEPIRSGDKRSSSSSKMFWPALNAIGISWSTWMRRTSTRTRISAMAGPSAASASGLPQARRAYPRGSRSTGCTSTTRAGSAVALPARQWRTHDRGAAAPARRGARAPIDRAVGWGAVSDGFEQSELLVPQEKLSDAGATVEVAAPKSRQKSGKIYGWNETNWGKTASVDKDLEEVNVTEYDALVLPGG